MDRLNLVPFVGEERARILREAGIDDIDKILRTSIEKIAELDGFSTKIAQKIRRYASEIESLGLTGREPIKELIVSEYRCPRCNAIVSKAESSCHRCGKVFYPAPANAEDIIAQSHIEILKDPKNKELWLKRARIFENLGLAEEAAICSVKADLIDMFGEEEEIKPRREIKKARKGLVNGNGVLFEKGFVGGIMELGKKNRLWVIFTALLLIIPVIVISTSLASKGIEIDGYFDDWKNIKGLQIYSKNNFVKEVKYFKDSKLLIYIEFKEGIFVSPVKYYYVAIGIFLDTDMKNTTGYEIEGIGADRLLLIYGYSGKIYGAKVMEYGGDGNTWAWKDGARIPAKTDGLRIELASPRVRDFFGLIVCKNTNYEMVSGIFSSKPGIYCVAEDGGGGVVEKDDVVASLTVYPMSTGSVKTKIKIENKGNSTTATFKVVLSNGEVLGENKYLTLNQKMKMDVIYVGGGKNGESIYIKPSFTARYFLKDSIAGKYIGTKPSRPSLDGIYAEWAYKSEGKDCVDIDADIDKVDAKVVDNKTILSFSVTGEMLKGTYMPMSLYMDSDGDTIPDPVDEYPHDFNNDGIPDSKSTLPDGKPDVDKDGIADYPYGNDKYLNTTVNGKNVSKYIGGKGGNIVGYVTIKMMLYDSGADWEKGTPSHTLEMKGFGRRILKVDGGILRVTHNSKYMEILLSHPSSMLTLSVKCIYEDNVTLVVQRKEVPIETSPPTPPIGNSDEKREIYASPTINSQIIVNPDKDSFAGKYARDLVVKYYNKIDQKALKMWINSLDLSKGDERTHRFTSKDFVDGNTSHFIEEKYAHDKMLDIIEKEGKRPIYRVELLDKKIFKMEWENLTAEAKKWVILHWVHDLEKLRDISTNYDPSVYKINWYDSRQIDTLEYLAYELSRNIDNYELAFEIACGIKSIDDARIGPFLAIYPTVDARMNKNNLDDKANRSPGATVTLQMVFYDTSEGDCNGDPDVYFKLQVGNWIYTTADVSDDRFSCRYIHTNSNVTGSTVTVGIHNWEADDFLCGSDEDFGGFTVTYSLTTKTWSGDTSTPYAYVDGPDGDGNIWFVIESDDDNEAKLGTYDPNYGSEPYTDGICFNDPYDEPTRITYYSGGNYWGYGSYANSYYEFYVSSGTSISVHLLPSSYNYDLYLYDPSWNLKASSTNTGTTQDDITFTADSSGYWKIRIYAADGYADWFKFWFTSGPDDKNYLDDSPTAGNSVNGYVIQSYDGHTYYDSSDDWKFYIDSSWISSQIVIYLWMKPNPNANFDLYLYDPDGNLKASSTNTGLGQADSITYQVQSTDIAGYWYAEVLSVTTSDYGNYSLFIWCGYRVEFHAVTNNTGIHTPMNSSNGVQVSYVVGGNTKYVYPNDNYYWIVYADRGSSYSYASESNLSDDAAGHRWISQNPPSGTITSSTVIYGYYYEQFYLTINTAHDTGYSSGELFGSPQSYSNPGSGWYDAGCTVQIWVDSPVTEGGTTYEFVSWSGSGTGSYTGPNNPANFTIQDVTTETANWQVVSEIPPLILITLVAVPIVISRYSKHSWLSRTSGQEGP